MREMRIKCSYILFIQRQERLQVHTENITKKSAETRRALSVRAVADSYGVSPGLVRLEIARGRLRAARIGRRLVIPVEALNEWLVGA
jgi:excisionase family DNA binding protein